MQKIIGVTELQRRFRTVFDEVVQQRIPYVLTRGSRPEAVLVPYEEFLRWQASSAEAVLSRFDKLMARMAAQNAAYSDDQVAADVASELAAVRAESND
jgi:prevent-host-death family protein